MSSIIWSYIAHFKTQGRKKILKKSTPKKFLIFQKMELSGSNIKKFQIFSQKKAFLILRRMELSYISGIGNLKTFLIFQGVTFRARKMKKKTLL